MKVDLYKEDYDDYGWYYICKDLGLIDYEYGNSQAHMEYNYFVVKVSEIAVTNRTETK